MKKILSIISLGFLLVANGNIKKKDDFKKRGTCESLISKDKIKEKTLERFSDKNKYYNVKIIQNLCEEKVISYKKRRNFSQANLNSYYNKLSSKDVSGTCTEVAATMTDYSYYENKNDFNKNDVFKYNMDYAINNGYYDYTSGTNCKYTERIVNASLSNPNLNINRETWWNYDNIYQGVKDFTNADKAQHFGIIGHDMLAVGYCDIKVQYITYKWKFFSKFSEYHLDTISYIACLDGWHDNYNWCYFPVDELEKNKNFYVIGVGD